MDNTIDTGKEKMMYVVSSNGSYLYYSSQITKKIMAASVCKSRKFTR